MECCPTKGGYKSHWPQVGNLVTWDQAHVTYFSPRCLCWRHGCTVMSVTPAHRQGRCTDQSDGHRAKALKGDRVWGKEPQGPLLIRGQPSGTAVTAAGSRLPGRGPACGWSWNRGDISSAELGQNSTNRKHPPAHPPCRAWAQSFPIQPHQVATCRSLEMEDTILMCLGGTKDARGPPSGQALPPPKAGSRSSSTFPESSLSSQHLT